MAQDIIRLDMEAKPFDKKCVGAVLNLSSDSVGTLDITYRGWGPEWVEYLRPVQLWRGEQLLFAGKVTAYSRANVAGEELTRITISDFRWLLERQTLGAQIAAIRDAMQTEPQMKKTPKGRVRLLDAAVRATRSWQSVAESVGVTAEGWAAESDVLSLNTERANYGVGAGVYARAKAVSAWGALQDMQASNPDAFFRVDYRTGTIEVISIRNAETVEYNTEATPIRGCESIQPQYEDAITGVCVVVSYADDEGVEHMYSCLYPEGVQDTDTGVRFFSTSADSQERAQRQLAYMAAQANAYYDAANELQWGGSITLHEEDVADSLVAKRVHITGSGTHSSWEEMAAVVSEESWDLLARTVTLTLGKTFADPSLAELEFEEDDTDTDAGGGGDGGGDTTTNEADDRERTTESETEDYSAYTRATVLYAESSTAKVQVLITASKRTGNRFVLELIGIDDPAFYRQQDVGERTGCTFELVPAGEYTLKLYAYHKDYRGGEEPYEYEDSVVVKDDGEVDFTYDIEIWESDAQREGNGGTLKAQAGVIGPSGIVNDLSAWEWKWTISPEPDQIINAEDRLEARYSNIPAEGMTVTYTVQAIPPGGAGAHNLSIMDYAVFPALGAGQTTTTTEASGEDSELSLSLEMTNFYKGGPSFNIVAITIESLLFSGPGQATADKYEWSNDLGWEMTNNAESCNVQTSNYTGRERYITITCRATLGGKSVEESLTVDLAEGNTKNTTTTTTSSTTTTSDKGSGTTSDKQKIYNLWLYCQFFGYDFGPSTFPYKFPSVFPDWLQWGMSKEEVDSRIASEEETPD